MLLDLDLDYLRTSACTIGITGIPARQEIFKGEAGTFLLKLGGYSERSTWLKVEELSEGRNNLVSS
jgi:hypothetical protein